MKNLFILLILWLCFIGIWNARWITMVDMPLDSCLESIDQKLWWFSFWNISHTGANEESMNYQIKQSFKNICWFYSSWWMYEYITVWKIFPVYVPKQNMPINLYTIYTGQDYTIKTIWESPYYTWAFFASGLSRFTPKSLYFWNGFSGWWIYAGQQSLPHNEAYLKSLEEPFRSAPTLQMYAYLGSPLLVARSQTGIVTDVFFQRKNVTDPIVIAQKYLWDKWYHP